MKTEKNIPGSNPRAGAIAGFRIAFGVVWAMDAYFKWQPAFANSFPGYIKDAIDGQPAVVRAWLNLWLRLVNINPILFARLVALGETSIAIGLLAGIFSNLVFAGGSFLSFIIWAVPEGFGGPYVTGSTDVGTGIIYIFVFLGLYLLSAGQYYGLDKPLRSGLGRWNFLSSAPQDTTG